jgi:3-hydroxyacyl-[acyl-carrier-protein] dehydratase
MKTNIENYLSVGPGKDENRVEMGFDEISGLLPYGDTFILIDKVVEIEKKKRIVCLKNISGSDPWLRGHFPGFAVLPGVVILEAFAQSASILVRKSYDQFNRKIGVMGGVKARFIKPIVPGDQVRINVEIDKLISKGGVVSATASVDEYTVTKATLTFGVL